MDTDNLPPIALRIFNNATPNNASVRGLWQSQRLPLPGQVQKQILHVQRRHTGHGRGRGRWDLGVQEDNGEEDGG